MYWIRTVTLNSKCYSVCGLLMRIIGLQVYWKNAFVHGLFIVCSKWILQSSTDEMRCMKNTPILPLQSDERSSVNDSFWNLINVLDNPSRVEIMCVISYLLKGCSQMTIRFFRAYWHRSFFPLSRCAIFEWPLYKLRHV